MVGHSHVMFWSKKVRTWFVGISLVIFFGGFVGMGEVDSRDPVVFLISAFITCPTNKVKQFTGFPIPVTIFGVRYFPEFVFYVIVDHDGFGWWQSPVIKSVQDVGFKLRHGKWDVSSGDCWEVRHKWSSYQCS